MPNELSAPEQQWIRNTGSRVYIHVYIHMIIYRKSVSVLFPRSLKAAWPAQNSGPVWDGGRGKSLMLLASNNKSQSYLPPCLIKYLEKKILWLIRLLHRFSIDCAPFCCPSWVNAKWWQSGRNKWLAIAGAETKMCYQNTVACWWPVFCFCIVNQTVMRRRWKHLKSCGRKVDFLIQNDSI